jgi:integrase
MPDMPRPALPHLQHEKTRHGKLVWYVRVGKGPRTRLPEPYGSVEFLAAYHAALDGQAPVMPRAGPAQGSFSWTVVLYRKSHDWARLSLATRRQRENILKGIEAALGSSKIADWKRGDIIAGRDKRADRPAAAKHFVQTMKGLFSWALDAGYVRADPAQGVHVARPKTEGFEAWTPDDGEAFRTRWPLGTRERVAFEVLFATGLRRGDVVKIGRPHLRDGVLRITTEKTGERVAVAMSPELAQAIAPGPIDEFTYIAAVNGKPMTKESFGNWFRDACTAASIDKSAHGIRKAAATADAEAGWSDAELDAKYGWTGRRMASLYTRAASREKLSLGAAERTKTRTFSPAPDVPLARTEKK